MSWGAVLAALKVTIISLLAYSCGSYFTGLLHGASAAVGGLWSMISAVAVLQTTRTKVWSMAEVQILGTFIGAVVSASYLSFLPFSTAGMALSMFFTVLLCHITRVHDHARLAATTVALIMVISSIMKVNPIYSATLRFCEACIGVMIAVLIILIWPEPKEPKAVNPPRPYE